VFFNLFSEAELFAAILIAHATHVFWGTPEARIIIIIIIIRHAPCQCVAPLATNSLHSGLSMASVMNSTSPNFDTVN